MTVDVQVVEPDLDVATAGQLMIENKYGCLPVVGRRAHDWHPDRGGLRPVSVRVQLNR